MAGDPWSIHKLAGDETCRMDLGSVGRVRDCTGSGPLIPGPITASVPYGLTKWEEDLGSVLKMKVA